MYALDKMAINLVGFWLGLLTMKVVLEKDLHLLLASDFKLRPGPKLAVPVPMI